MALRPIERFDEVLVVVVVVFMAVVLCLRPPRWRPVTTQDRRPADLLCVYAHNESFDLPVRQSSLHRCAEPWRDAHAVEPRVDPRRLGFHPLRRGCIDLLEELVGHRRVGPLTPT